jgi:hypothetical protein
VIARCHAARQPFVDQLDRYLDFVRPKKIGPLHNSADGLAIRRHDFIAQAVGSALPAIAFGRIFGGRCGSAELAEVPPYVVAHR